MDLYYWPPSAPRETALESFVKAFEALGYATCSTSDLEPRKEKVAIFAKPSGEPTHAARQLSNGRWTSKLGKNVDIEHELNGLTSRDYGSPVLFLERRI